MAFDATKFLPLSSMANSNSTRHWTYATTEAKSTIVASGYFDNAAKYNGLKAQDVIWAVCETGGTETFELVFVDAVATTGTVTTLSSTLTLA